MGFYQVIFDSVFPEYLFKDILNGFVLRIDADRKRYRYGLGAVGEIYATLFLNFTDNIFQWGVISFNSDRSKA